MAKKGMKGEVNGSPGAAMGDVGSNAKIQGDNDAYYMGGKSGLGVSSRNAGTPKGAADLSRKGANKGGM